MRNLKKILALVMALVMSMSLITIANASDFTDADEITYEEATDVMSAIGVIEGFEDGSFDPDGTLTREQAAKLIAYMLLGDNAERLGIDSSSFNDVAATRWSAPAIEYCVSLGIIDGAGDGNFYPAGQLTANAFAKVLLTALGYDSEKEGLVGSNWAINTAALAMEVGLDNGIEGGLAWNSVITREEAAQMALNAIKAPLVAYESGATVMVGDTPVTFGSGDAYYITTTLAREQRISDRRLTNASSTTPNYTVEFGEKYFPLLRLDSESDDFNRPSHTWVYENKELGTYVDYDLLVETYTAGVSNRTLYDLLGRSNLEDYDFTYYVDGYESTINANTILSRTDKTFGGSGRGVLTQVFVDHEWDNATGRIVITSVNTWLAKVATSYNAKREDATLNVYVGYTASGSPVVTTTDSQAFTVNSADVDGVEDLVENDYVLVNMSAKYGANATDYDVVKISDVEIMADSTITKYSKNSNSDSDSDTNQALFNSVTTGGVEYKGSKKAFYSDEVLDLYNNNLLTGNTYNIYLDPYGYAIGVDLYAGQDNYVFITGFDISSSAIASATASAAGIFLDGQMKTISVNVKDTNKNIERASNAYFGKLDTYGTLAATRVNRWFTYTVDSNNVYTLSPATRMFTTVADNDPTASHTIRCDSVVLDQTDASANDSDGKHPSVTSGSEVRAYGNDDSIYIVADLGTVADSSGRKVITGVDGLYTGVQNVEIDLEYKTSSDSSYVGTIEIGGDTTDADADTALYDNTYTLYDKNNYIIASIVIGEAKGTSANYAYILTAATSEEIRNGTYYWTFDAVVDGTIQTLTVESKFSNTISDLRPGHVQELRFNGDYVSAIKNVTNDKIYSGAFAHRISAGDHEVYDMGHATGTGYIHSCSYSDTTGWEYTNRLDAEDLHIEGRTLRLGGGKDYGLTFVSSSTPTVVIQEEDGSVEEVEYSSVSAALASLGDADGDSTNGKLGFEGRLVAILNSQGVAEWLVIISDTPITTSAGGVATDKRTMTLTVNCIGVVTTSGAAVNLGTYTYTVKNGDAVPMPTILGWTQPTTQYVGTAVPFVNGGSGTITLTYTR